MKAGICLALLAVLASPVLAESNLRDPFARIYPASATPTRLDLSVTGLMESGDHYVAIVRYGDETSILEEGDEFEGTRVLKISPEGLTLMVPGENKRVRIGEKDVNLAIQYAWVYGLEDKLR